MGGKYGRRGWSVVWWGYPATPSLRRPHQEHLKEGWECREACSKARGGRRLKKPLGPLEKSGRDSKNTLRAEKPSGPGVNIQWVAAPERSDSQQRPWWICGVISFSTVLIRGQAVSLGSWLCCTDSCGLTEKNVLWYCCQVQSDQRKGAKAPLSSYIKLFTKQVALINKYTSHIRIIISFFLHIFLWYRTQITRESTMCVIWWR